MSFPFIVPQILIFVNRDTSDQAIRTVRKQWTLLVDQTMSNRATESRARPGTIRILT